MFTNSIRNITFAGTALPALIIGLSSLGVVAIVNAEPDPMTYDPLCTCNPDGYVECLDLDSGETYYWGVGCDEDDPGYW